MNKCQEHSSFQIIFGPKHHFEMLFDDILSQIGEFGVYQIVVYFVLGLTGLLNGNDLHAFCIVMTLVIYKLIENSIIYDISHDL